MDNNAVLHPKYKFDRLSDITVDVIKGWGVKAIGLDIDNTLCYDPTTKTLPGADEWLKRTISEGLNLIIVSNGTRRRTRKLAKRYGLKYVGFACKPSPKGYLAAAEKAGCRVEEMAFIGDRLFTDVKGANLVNAVSVYVAPTERDFAYRANRKKRAIEQEILREMEMKTL